MIQFIRNRYDDFLLEYIDDFPPTSQRWLLRRSHGVRQVALILNHFAVVYQSELNNKTEKGAQILQDLGFLQEDKHPSIDRHWHLYDRETFEGWFGDLGVPELKIPSFKIPLHMRVRDRLPW